MKAIYDAFEALIFNNPNLPPNLTANTITKFIARSFSCMIESLNVELLDYKKPKDITAPIFNIFTKISIVDPKT